MRSQAGHLPQRPRCSRKRHPVHCFHNHYGGVSSYTLPKQPHLEVQNFGLTLEILFLLRTAMHSFSIMPALGSVWQACWISPPLHSLQTSIPP